MQRLRGKMYIINPYKIDGKIKYHSWVAKYLMDNNVPLLSYDRGIYWFADSALVHEILENAPMWVKGILLVTSK
jgi:hypothetical protein